MTRLRSRTSPPYATDGPPCGTVGQVVGLLRQLGKRPPNTDIFGYYLDQR